MGAWSSLRRRVLSPAQRRVVLTTGCGLLLATATHKDGLWVMMAHKQCTPGGEYQRIVRQVFCFDGEHFIKQRFSLGGLLLGALVAHGHHDLLSGGNDDRGGDVKLAQDFGLGPPGFPCFCVCKSRWREKPFAEGVRESATSARDMRTGQSWLRQGGSDFSVVH